MYDVFYILWLLNLYWIQWNIIKSINQLNIHNPKLPKYLYVSHFSPEYENIKTKKWFQTKKMSVVCFSEILHDRSFSMPNFDSWDQNPYRNPSYMQGEKKNDLLNSVSNASSSVWRNSKPLFKNNEQLEAGLLYVLKKLPSSQVVLFLYSDVAATQEVPIVQRCFGINLPRQHQVHGRCHAFRWSLGALQEEFSLYQTLAWNIRWGYLSSQMLNSLWENRGVKICLLKGNCYTKTGLILKKERKKLSIEAFTFEKLIIYFRLINGHLFL
jgi:hypothetical protein